MNRAEAAISTVCEYRGVSREGILSTARTADVCIPRQEAQYILRKVSTYSTPMIGEYFKRDHTSVLNSLRRVEIRMKDDLYRQDIEEMIWVARARADDQFRARAAQFEELKNRMKL